MPYRFEKQPVLKELIAKDIIEDAREKAPLNGALLVFIRTGSCRTVGKSSVQIGAFVHRVPIYGCSHQYRRAVFLGCRHALAAE